METDSLAITIAKNYLYLMQLDRGMGGRFLDSVAAAYGLSRKEYWWIFREGDSSLRRRVVEEADLSLRKKIIEAVK